MKALKLSYYLISVLVIVWFLLSWFEIGSNHMDPDFTYHSMNLIGLLFGW